MNSKFLTRLALVAATTTALVGSAFAFGPNIKVDGLDGACHVTGNGNGREIFPLLPGSTHTMQIYNAPCATLGGGTIYVCIHNTGSGNITFPVTAGPNDDHYSGTFTLPTVAQGFCATGPVFVCTSSTGQGGTAAASVAPCDITQDVHIVASSDGTENGTIVCGGGGNPPQSVLSGTKYYDTNGNGAFDLGEQPLAGFHIHLSWFDANNVEHTQDVTTGTDGSYAFNAIPSGVAFTVSEVPPYPDTGNTNITWIQSGPADGSSVPGAGAAAMKWTGTTGGVDITGLNFYNYEVAPIGGKKWFDHNANGIDDDGAGDGIQGFKITVVVTSPVTGTTTDTIFTDANGNWTDGPFALGSTYTVTETFPNGNWVQTFPSGGSYSGSVDGTNTALNFGNYCLVPSGGLTLGFWSNKNGQAIMTGSTTGSTIKAPILTLLNSLHLRDANGSAHVFTSSYSAFRTWILGATATNMAYMLSAQLAASALDVYNHNMDGGAFDLCSNENISDLINEASTELGLHGLTLSGSPYRSYQERLKNCLDRLNNGALVIPSHSCPVVYP